MTSFFTGLYSWAKLELTSNMFEDTGKGDFSIRQSHQSQEVPAPKQDKTVLPEVPAALRERTQVSWTSWAQW